MDATTGLTPDPNLPSTPAPVGPVPVAPRPRSKRKIVIAVVILIAIFLWFNSRSGRPTNNNDWSVGAGSFTTTGEQVSVKTIDKSLLIRDPEHSLGSPDAKVEIVEFSDFQCPFCLEAFPIIRALTVEYGDRIHYVYRHFPISSIHDRAMAAAEASECAREQGKFWPYHDKIFQNQNNMSDSDLESHAQAVGMEVAKFDTCLKERRYKAVVDRDIMDGKTLGVVGTPTWFINGQRVQGVIAADNFKAGIEKLLK